MEGRSIVGLGGEGIWGHGPGLLGSKVMVMVFRGRRRGECVGGGCRGFIKVAR